MTFDLEKARASDEALPYPLDAKEIWISGKGQMHINPPNEPSIFFTLSDLCEFRNLFHGQAAEIERLRAENRELLHEIKDLPRIIDTGYKQLVCDRTGLNERQDLPEGIRRMAASVQELEEALVEYQRLGKTISEAVVPCLTAHGNCDQCRPKAKAACDAIETIRKGKIGSGDHIGEPNKLIGLNADHQYQPEAPRSWQVTDERKAAIQMGLDYLEYAYAKSGRGDIHEHAGQLRAMLEEARQ